MSGSREQMLRLLQEAKATVRARIPDMPAAARRHASRRLRTLQSGDDKENETGATRDTPPVEGSATADTVTNKLDAKAHTMEFLSLYYQIFRSFVLDATKFNLPLEGLDGNARRILHLLAERCNLDHQSAGTGDTRAIMIKKGPLFYQYQDAYQTVDLERIANEINSKSSKFELKRAVRLKDEEMTSGVIGSYDEDAYRKVLRYQRGTDEYRHAVDMGYSQDELQRLESGDQALDGSDEAANGTSTLPPSTSGRLLEELLSRPADASTLDENLAEQDVVGRARLKGTPSPQPQQSMRSAPTDANAGSDGRQATAPTSSGPGAAKANTTFEETCRGCWTRVPLHIAVRDWRCSRYCAQCGKDTIWMLRSVPVEPAPTADAAKTHASARGAHGAAAASDDGETSKGGANSGKRKRRHRDGEEGDFDAEDAHDHSHSDDSASDRDAEADEEPLELEDVIEMANSNDLDTGDINWLRRFCTLHEPHLQKHIVFCIDLQDLQQLPIFQGPVRQARRQQKRHERQRVKRGRTEGESAAVANPIPAPQYVLVRASKSAHASLAALLGKVVAAAFTLSSADGSVAQPVPPEQAEKHMALALPNASAYGTEAVAIVQLRPGEHADDREAVLHVNADALAALEKEFGTRHVHLVPDLEAAIREAE